MLKSGIESALSSGVCGEPSLPLFTSLYLSPALLKDGHNVKATPSFHLHTAAVTQLPRQVTGPALQGFCPSVTACSRWELFHLHCGSSDLDSSYRSQRESNQLICDRILHSSTQPAWPYLLSPCSLATRGTHYQLRPIWTASQLTL